MNKILVAIDPGASGGVAWLKPGVGVVAIPAPGEIEGWVKLRKEIQDSAKHNHTQSSVDGFCEIVCYIEQVTGYVAPRKEEGESKTYEPGSAMFNFGKVTGFAMMAFAMIGAKIVEVPPRVWQAPLFAKRNKASKTEWKRTLKGMAQQKFPQIKVTLKTADALLILWFASLKEGQAGVLTAGSPSSAGITPVARKSGHEFSGSLPDDPTESECEAAREGLFVAKWKGSDFVFRIGKSNRVTVARKATLDDIRTLPTKVVLV